jgi:CO/xanthine dehydrogenase FAD-binding subunit
VRRIDEEHRDLQQFAEPQNLQDALDLKRASGEHGMFVVGGTDVGVQLRRHLVHPEVLISLARITDLGQLERRDDKFVVGGAVTHRRIERSELFADAYVALQEACATVGSIQTRNVGTIGGNLANASPAADTAPVLLALGANVHVEGPEGARTIPLDRLFRGYRRTELRADEVIVAVEVPVARPRTGSAFSKLGRRRAMEISVACVGALIELDDTGVCTRAGIGVGAVAPTPLRVHAAEEALLGKPVEPEAVRQATEAVRAAAEPIDDARASAHYRDRVLAALVRRTIGRAAQRAATERGSPC